MTRRAKPGFPRWVCPGCGLSFSYVNVQACGGDWKKHPRNLEREKSNAIKAVHQRALRATRRTEPEEERRRA
jgi:hypothetical protein